MKVLSSSTVERFMEHFHVRLAILVALWLQFLYICTLSHDVSYIQDHRLVRLEEEQTKLRATHRELESRIFKTELVLDRYDVIPDDLRSVKRNEIALCTHLEFKDTNFSCPE